MGSTLYNNCCRLLFYLPPPSDGCLVQLKEVIAFQFPALWTTIFLMWVMPVCPSFSLYILCIYLIRMQLNISSICFQYYFSLFFINKKKCSFIRGNEKGAGGLLEFELLSLVILFTHWISVKLKMKILNYSIYYNETKPFLAFSVGFCEKCKYWFDWLFSDGSGQKLFHQKQNIGMGLMTHTAAAAVVVASVVFVNGMGISKWTAKTFYASHFCNLIKKITSKRILCPPYSFPFLN